MHFPEAEDRFGLPASPLTAADIAHAEALGIDVKGMMLTAGARRDDLKQMLGVLVNDVVTPAGDTTNASTLTAQIMALS